MKRFNKILLLASASLLLASCGDYSIPRSYKVHFEVGETGTPIEDQTVKEGWLIKGVGTPENSRVNLFRGWYTDSAYTDPFDIETYRVFQDLTLYAKWSFPTATPSEFSLGSDGFTKSIKWIQTGVTDVSQVSVSVCQATRQIIGYDDNFDPIYDYVYNDSTTPVSGTAKIENQYEITFTADQAYPGGRYCFYLTTNGDTISGNQKDASGAYVYPDLRDVSFHGAGTKDEPYLVYNEADLLALTTKSYDENTYATLKANITLNSVYSDKVGATYNGHFDGNGNYITLRNNCGLFYTLGEKAEVYNLNVQGSLSGSNPSLGGLANYNYGKIYNVGVKVSVQSDGGIVNDFKSLSKGGVGGLVGTNYGDITKIVSDSNQSNVIMGNIGVGGLVGINYGKIHDMIDDDHAVGCIVGAYNGNEASLTVANSYAGVVCGVNYGTLDKVQSDGKINCRRLDDGKEGEGATNVGGVVGYNGKGGILSECFFEGMRCVGDTNVGGIAGYNDGTISDCYSGRRCRQPSATPYTERQFVSPVTGSYNVGGIAGNIGENSSIKNTFSTCNVWSYKTEGYAIAKKADNSIGMAKVQNPRLLTNYLGQKYGACFHNDLVQPEGSGNVVEDNSQYVGLAINHPLGLDVVGSPTYSKADGKLVATYQKSEELVKAYGKVLGAKYGFHSTFGVILLSQSANATPIQ